MSSQKVNELNINEAIINEATINEATKKELKIKELLLVNLTASIALSTSSLLPEIATKGSQIDPIAASYWLFIALLLVVYAYVDINEGGRNQNTQRLLNIKGKYCIALEVNLACIAVLIVTLVECYRGQMELKYLIWLLMPFYIIEVALILLYPIFTFFDSKFRNDIISHYHEIEDKIGNPIMLVAAAVFFDIGIYLLVHL